MAKDYNINNDNIKNINIKSTDSTDNINKLFYSEEINIPKSLLPENIKKNLEYMDEKDLDSARQRADKLFSKNSVKKRITFGGAATIAAACIAALIFTNGSFNGSKTIKPEKLSGNNGDIHIASSAIAEKTTDKSSSTSDGTLKNDNYIAAYESMKKYNDEINKIRGDATTDSDMAKGSSTGFNFNPDDIVLEGASDSTDTSNSAIEKLESASSSAKKSYSDTNIRTSGVDEGDIVKTDGKYIYVLNKNSYKDAVTIYLANNAKPKKISSISFKKNTVNIRDMYVYKDRIIITAGETFEIKKQKIKIKSLYNDENSSFKNFNAKSWSGYLSGTCETSDDVLYSAANGMANYTYAFVYDISKAEKPKLLHKFFQDGSYNSSRMVNGILYLFSSRGFNTENINKKEPTSYIPQVGGKCVEDGDVAVPDKSTGMDYTVISSIDTKNCSYIDKQAVLNGESQNLYVSSNNIYLYGQQYFALGANFKSTIIKLSYNDGKIKKLATGSFKGYINDDYCIDEKDGKLRFVTTYYNKKGNELNGLFIMDENLKLTGKIANLAKNEQIYSARFIGNTAYFVTYRNTDPLFAVDVSNPAKPKMLGYLKIPGFSRYLHPYSNTLLLGIGEETDASGNSIGIKMSMFDISNPADIKEVAKKVLKGSFDCEAQYNPNALFIDTQKNIFGFGFEKYSSDIYSYSNKRQYNYMVYSYNNKKGFVKKLDYNIFNRKDTDILDFDIYYVTFTRGIYIDDNFYVVTTDSKNIIKCFDLKTFKEK